MDGLNSTGDVTNPRTALRPQINCSGSDENQNVNVKEKCNLDDSGNTDISVTNLSDYCIPSKLFNDIINVKSCYSDIVNAFDPNRNDESELRTDHLTRDQIISGITKHKLKKDDIRDHLISLLDNVRCICLPTYVKDTHLLKPKSDESKSIDIVSSIESLSADNKLNFDSIKNELNSLKLSIDNFQNGTPEAGCSTFKFDVDSSSGSTFYRDSLSSNSNNKTFNDDNVKKEILSIPPFDTCIPNFLNGGEIKEVSDYLDGCTFTAERGHGTIKYGESYTYSGSRNESIEMPPIISKLMSNLNDNHVGEGKPLLNQCLVNRYDGPQSYIKDHSDDERSIERDSSIFTIIIGQTRTINFLNMISGDAQSFRPESGSMYSMSRLSQEYYRHGIDKEEGDNDIRHSLTFRSLSWRNHNRTVLMGDSNTKNVKFGADVGTMGKSIYGKQIDAFTIDQIDPLKCIAINNVVLHCGINNIKSKYINSDHDIKDLYKCFKSKIEDIRRINKKCRILISPILPTRLPGLNKRAVYYNSLLFNDLAQSNLRVEFVYGYDAFLDQDDCLNTELARFHDHLHLNASGVRFMARCIKDLILIKKKRGDKQHSSKPKPRTMVGSKHRS